VKNRIHGALARHNAQVRGVTDPFGCAGRRLLNARLPDLPVHTREAVAQELNALDFLGGQIEATEHRLEANGRER
jgi:transposase